jgi:hypothetical protein
MDGSIDYWGHSNQVWSQRRSNLRDEISPAHLLSVQGPTSSFSSPSKSEHPGSRICDIRANIDQVPTTGTVWPTDLLCLFAPLPEHSAAPYSRFKSSRVELRIGRKSLLKKPFSTAF